MIYPPHRRRFDEEFVSARQRPWPASRAGVMSKWPATWACVRGAFHAGVSGSAWSKAVGTSAPLPPGTIPPAAAAESERELPCAAPGGRGAAPGAPLKHAGCPPPEAPLPAQDHRDRAHLCPVAPNRLALRTAPPAGPDRGLGGRHHLCPYVATAEGWLYVAGVRDLSRRKRVGSGGRGRQAHGPGGPAPLRAR